MMAWEEWESLDFDEETPIKVWDKASLEEIILRENMADYAVRRANTRKRHAAVINCLEAGLSVKETARKLDISDKLVYSIRKRWGLA